MGSLIVSTYNFIQEKAEKSHILYHVKRAIFPLIIGTLVISGLLFSSTVAYFVFYWSYIPTVGITREVYLQFSRDVPPWGSVDLANVGMLSDQPYRAVIELELPRTKNNLEIGNFMVSLSLISSSNTTLATSSRPAILTYTSPLISTSLTVLNSPLFITGFKKESETLLVPLFERFEFSGSRSARPRWAYIEIATENNKIQVYQTKLIFVAQFEGVRWFMYSHRIVAFCLFTSLFFISSSLFAGLAWFIFSYHPSINAPPTDKAQTVQSSKKFSSGKELKEEEPDDHLTISHSVTSHHLPEHSTSGITETYPPVTAISAKEEARQGSWPTESSLSEIGEEDLSTNVKKESVSGDTHDDDVGDD